MHEFVYKCGRLTVCDVTEVGRGGGDGVMSEADLEQLVLLRPKGADVVSDVIPDDDDLPTLRVLWGEHGHPPGNHPDLREGGREGQYISAILFIGLSDCADLLTT